jgi:hypothetical protein
MQYHHGQYKVEVQQGNGGSLLCINVYLGGEKHPLSVIDLHLDEEQVYADVYDDGTPKGIWDPVPEAGCQRVPLIDVELCKEYYDIGGG